MSSNCCSALAARIIRVLFFGVALSLAISGGEARAGGLSVVVRVQQDFYQPLVPVTKNFRTCFQTDSSGAQVIGICTAPDESSRTPAGGGDSGTPASPPKRVPAAGAKDIRNKK